MTATTNRMLEGRKAIVLTKPLVSMNHRKELICEITVEPYEMNIPTANLNGASGNTHVVDVIDSETAGEAILILTSVMKSALERAGGDLKGRIFRFQGGEIREGKRYRDVQVEEWV